MKSFKEWSNINEEKVSGMNISQMMAAGPTVMASAASQLLMYINMSIEDKEVFPHKIEAESLKKEVDAFIRNYEKILKAPEDYQKHPYTAGDQVIRNQNATQRL
jgi:hypothetical protein